jgi:hypothetical protein
MMCLIRRVLRTVPVAAILLCLPGYALSSLLADRGASAESLAMRHCVGVSWNSECKLLTSASGAPVASNPGDTDEEVLSTAWTFTNKGGSSGWSGSGQPTATTLSGPSSSNYGTSVTFTATVTVTGPHPTGSPSGTVNFYDGTILLGSAQAPGPGLTTTAKFSISTLSKGTHSIQAEYLGTTNMYIYSYSSPVYITVN